MCARLGVLASLDLSVCCGGTAGQQDSAYALGETTGGKGKQAGCQGDMGVRCQE